MRGHFWPFADVQNGNQREVTRRCGNLDECSGSRGGCFVKMQAARLPLQLDYFGAREATIFSKHGSPRNELDFGSNQFLIG
jgi:hypothetical protein